MRGELQGITAARREEGGGGRLVANQVVDIDVDDADVRQLLLDVGQRNLSRREVLCRGIRLGLTVPVIGWLLTTLGDDAARA
jgi:hypothetical protein